MKWIILIIAGLFEVAFASCLGKAKESTGNEMYFWYAAFLITMIISMGLLIKATQTLAIGDRICSVDRGGSSWNSSGRNLCI